MSGETPVCKSCESADLEQQLSLIASPNKGGDASVSAGPERACSMDGSPCCGGDCAFAA
jgi:hypothetical protein